jgi:pilus assembly protein CpaB
LAAVTIGLTLDQAVLLTHALHYGKIHLAEASRLEAKGPGIGDHAFASALLKTKKRWSDSGEER